VPETAASVPALIALSLLEALRNLDTPVEDGLDELAEEIVARRLGLSPTVAAQIQRYRQATERGADVPVDEVVSTLRLVGRRPDASLVFADAGRRAARYAARGRAAPARTVSRVAPAAVGRGLAARAARRIVARVFRGELRWRPEGTEVRVPLPLSIVALPEGSACDFYGAAFGELLRTLSGFEGAVVHERCCGRGDDGCLWRTAAAACYE